MRPAAPLAPALGSFKPDHRRKLRPVDRIKPFVLGADRHRAFQRRDDSRPSGRLGLFAILVQRDGDLFPASSLYGLRSQATSTANRFRSASEQWSRAPSCVARKTTRGGWPASSASCQRGAHKHQRSPGLRPGKPNCGTGVRGPREAAASHPSSWAIGSHARPFTPPGAPLCGGRQSYGRDRRPGPGNPSRDQREIGRR